MVLRLIVAGQDVIPRTSTPYVAYHTIDFTLDNGFNFSNVAVISAEIIPDLEPHTHDDVSITDAGVEENTDGQ